MKSLRNTLPVIIKIALFAAWLILLGMLMKREVFIRHIDSPETVLIAQTRENHYYGIWHNQQRIGYISERTQPGPSDLLQVQVDSELRLALAGQHPLPITIHLTAQLSPAQTLQSLNGQLTCATYTLLIQGAMQGQTFQFSLHDNSGVIFKQLALPALPLLPLGQQPQLMKQLPKTGDKALRSFPALSAGRSLQSVIHNLGEEKLLVNNRIDKLMHFSETFNGIELHYWLNKQGKIVKTTLPGGLILQSEPEFMAKAIIPLPAGAAPPTLKPIALDGLTPPADTKNITYRFMPAVPSGWHLAGGRQQISGDLLSLRLEKLNNPADLAPCSSGEQLEPIPYDFPDKQNAHELAKTILADETEPVKQILLLAGWVRAKAKAPSAATVPELLSLITNRPDNQQQATSFAALARAAGIPATIVHGIALRQQKFLPQSWNEVCVNGGWVSLDPAANQFPADLTHIRLLQNDLKADPFAAELPINLRIAVVEEPDGHPTTH